MPSKQNTKMGNLNATQEDEQFEVPSDWLNRQLCTMTQTQLLQVFDHQWSHFVREWSQEKSQRRLKNCDAVMRFITNRELYNAYLKATTQLWDMGELENATIINVTTCLADILREERDQDNCV